MQIKRFEARDMATALRKVKKEFGEQAVILSAKTLRQPGGIFGTHKRKCVEITAASDRFPDQDASPATGFKAVLPPAMPDPTNPLGTELPVKTVSTPRRPAPQPTAPVEPQKDKAHGAVAPAVRTPKPGPDLARFKRALLAQDVSSELADRMVHRVTHSLGGDGAGADAELNANFKRLLSEQLSFAGPQAHHKSGPRVVALVGPSGVGKSTTVAKLAAAAIHRDGARVGLVSLDHHSIGGTAQLEVLSQVMQLPLTVIKEKHQVREVLFAMQSCDLVLVDTPGVSANRTQDLRKLDQILRSLRPDETHLLLSATTKDRDLHLQAEQFNRVGYNRLIFTKLDETTVYGNLLNLMTVNQTPLAYVTDGPRVPDGLKTATAESVIELFAPQEAAGEGDAKESSAPGADAAQKAATPRPPKLGVGDPQAVQHDYFVANRNSDIFHQPDCKAVKRINPDNILVFKNMGEAKAQKYKPCRMCCAMRLSKRPAFETFRLKAVGG